jgi:hypothetical protein
MALSSKVAAIALLSLAGSAAAASGQTLAAEMAIGAGHSTEAHASAAATQLRVFGDLNRWMHFYAEGAWGATSENDVAAFGAAYPYSNRVQIVESYVEAIGRSDRGVAGVKVGRYRTPFGISSGSDQGYTGFVRAPLVRYDGYFALSNGFLEHGIDVVAGVPQFTVEASIAAPAGVGEADRRSGLDTVLRAQSYLGGLVAGISYIRTQPYQSPRFARGRARFTGVDLRWMRSGVQLRGEWMTGRPFDGTSTTGWYADLIVHRVGMGPVTAVARVEELDYEAVSPFDMSARRQTVGARVRVLQPLVLEANLTHQTGGAAGRATRALDVGLTYSVRLR